MQLLVPLLEIIKTHDYGIVKSNATKQVTRKSQSSSTRGWGSCAPRPPHAPLGVRREWRRQGHGRRKWVTGVGRYRPHLTFTLLLFTGGRTIKFQYNF